MSFEESIVRILNGLGETAGTGFFVSRSGQVLTCTHVIGNAKPGEHVCIKLYPFSEANLSSTSNAPSINAVAAVVSRTEPNAEDIALLQVVDEHRLRESHDQIENQEIKARVFTPLILGTSLNTENRLLKTYGFPEAKSLDGLPGKCEVIGFTREHGYRQISVRSDEVSYGFSGAPVWDEQLCTVAGIIVSIIEPHADAAQRQQGTSFVIPVEVVRDACPSLTASTGKCPYRGFESFLVSDADNYFGRDHAIAGLLARLRKQNVVAVLGVSGSGKSSLVCAGLYKGLQQNNYPELLGSRLLLIKPGLVPLANLLSAVIGDSRSAVGTSEVTAHSSIQELNVIPVNEVRSLLASGVDAIKTYIKQWSKSHTCMIVVDQLERLFIECRDDASVNEFIEVLSDISSEECKVVLSIRADFYGRVLRHSALSQLVARSQPITLTSMNADELRSAIEQPATRNHVAVEPALVEALIIDVINRPADLPFLEFTLSELWRQDAQTGILTLKAYRSLKVADVDGVLLTGVHSVVVNQAERFWKGLNRDEQSATKALLLRLVSYRKSDEFGLHPTAVASRRAFLEDLDAPTAALAEKLAGTFLLTASTDSSTNKATIELSHEALIHGWVRLNGWISEYSNYIVWYERDLLPYFRHWQDGSKVGAPDERLLPASMVAEAASWLNKHRDLLEGSPRQFIEANIEADRQRRNARTRRRSLGFVIAIVLLLSIISVLYLKTKSSLEETEDFHERGLAAFADHDMLTAEVLMANALSVNDSWFLRPFTRDKDADIREHLLQARNRGAQSVWLEDPHGRVLAISHDLQITAIASNNEVVLFNAVTRSLITRLPKQSGYPVKAAFSPDRKFLAYAFGHKDKGLVPEEAWSVESDGAVHVWNLEAGTEYMTVPLKALQSTVIQKQVSAIAFPTTSSSLLALATEDGLIRVYSIATKQELAHLEGHSLPVWGLSFDPHLETLASASSDDTVRLWNLRTKSQIGNAITGHEDTVESVVFNPTGELLASGSSDGTVRVWNVASHQEVKRFSNHFGSITAVAFEPAGALLASACEDQYIRILDMNSGNEVLRLRSYEGPPLILAFSSSGMIMAGGSHGVEDSTPVSSGWLRLWQMGSVPELTSIYTGEAALSTIALTTEYIISGDANQDIKIWRRDGTLVRTLKAASSVQGVTVSKDGKWIASAESSWVEVWSLSEFGEPKPVFTQKATQVYAVSFDPRADRIALGSDRTIEVCSISEAKRSCDQFDHKGGRVFNIAFSPDGEQIATAGGDNSVRLWDSHSYKELHRSTAHTKDVWGIAYDPSGSVIASSGADRTIRFMNTTDLSEVRSALERHRGTVVSVTFTTDGTYLVSCGLDPILFT